RWSGRARSIVAGLAVGVPFVLEPLLWSVRYGYVPHPVPLWIAEAVVGVGLLAWIASARRTRPAPTT
ncbi:MAG: hypothetical protein M3P43_04480, partial [Actinomycetota bacterium]|nr:hypothetical protein [Actinomycetota bacterium]